MAAISTHMASTKFSMFGWTELSHTKQPLRKRNLLSLQPSLSSQTQEPIQIQEQEQDQNAKKQEQPLRPSEAQPGAKSKVMTREYGGQWLSSTTRHVRIYAAYLDPVTCAFDQTQMDKLTIILDPTDEFVWTPETTNTVYSYFQELVDHYEGAPLTEYTLRLIGSDVEHYIRKLLYKGKIQYNMNARVLNFSMGKPRVGFNYNDSQLLDVNSQG